MQSNQSTSTLIQVFVSLCNFFNVNWHTFFQLMLNKYSGNLLISPISVKLALVLLYEGAQDNTARELANVMHLPVGRWDNRDKFKLILQSLRVILPS